LDVYAEHRTSPFQNATPGELDHPASLQITRDGTPGPNDLPSLLPGTNDEPRRVEEDDDIEGSTEHLAKLVAPDASFKKEVARLEHGRADLERQLSETLAAQSERDRRFAQLTDRLAQKSAVLERAEANAAEVKKHAGLELRELQAKLDELMLSRDEHLRSLEQARRALQKATSRAADADERSQPAWEHETELAEARVELEGRKSELEAARLRLTDAENRCAKSKAEADTLRAQTAAGLVNTDVDQVIHRLMERMRAMETEMSSLRGNQKSIESMECRNEGESMECRNEG
jgi:chromosome segregation ATPase